LGRLEFPIHAFTKATVTNKEIHTASGKGLSSPYQFDPFSKRVFLIQLISVASSLHVKYYALLAERKRVLKYILVPIHDIKFRVVNTHYLQMN